MRHAQHEARHATVPTQVCVAAVSQTLMVPAVTQRDFANPAHSCVRLLGFLATGRCRYDASSPDDCSCLLRGAPVPADGAGGGVAARRSGLTHQRMNLAIVCLRGHLWYVESYCLRYLSYSTVILRLFYGYFVPAWVLFFPMSPISSSSLLLFLPVGQDLEAASLQRCDRQVAASFMKTCKTLPFSFIMTTGLHGVPASCRHGLQGKRSDRAVRS